MRFSSTDLFKYHVINLLNSSCAYKHQHDVNRKNIRLSQKLSREARSGYWYFINVFFSGSVFLHLSNWPRFPPRLINI